MNTERNPINLKKVILWFIIVFLGIISVYLGFISLISLWIGFENTRQPGFWVPITGGATLLLAVFWIYTRTASILLRLMKNRDSLNF